MSATSERAAAPPLPRVATRPVGVAVLGLTALGVVVVATGCGRREIPRFDLSGTVTYDGKPIPRGYLVLRPDREAGNEGPGAQADIRDGRYATLPGRGTIGGPHVIDVYGFDGKPYEIPAGALGGVTLTNQVGKPLFKVATFHENLPRNHAGHDFAIPAGP